jgi:hypothetical protein
MSEVVNLAPPLPKMRDLVGKALPVRTDAVSVLFTTEEETLVAARVASAIARAMAVPLTIVHCRAVPYPLSVDTPAGMSPAESDAFSRRLMADGIEARVRVILCRNRDKVTPSAFRGHSIIVIGGRRRLWPTASERWRRRLEAAGHFVLFVDVRDASPTDNAEASCA